MKNIIWIAVCLTGLTLSGCSSSVKSSGKDFSPEKIAQVVGPGDTVKVKTVSGGEYQFLVTGVTEKELIGGGVTVQNAEIDTLSVRERDGVEKTFRIIHRTGKVLLLMKILKDIKD